MLLQAITDEMFQEDEHMAKAVASMAFVKCNYTKHKTPQAFLFETLSILAWFSLHWK